MKLHICCPTNLIRFLSIQSLSNSKTSLSSSRFKLMKIIFAVPVRTDIKLGTERNSQYLSFQKVWMKKRTLSFIQSVPLWMKLHSIGGRELPNWGKCFLNNHFLNGTLLNMDWIAHHWTELHCRWIKSIICILTLCNFTKPSHLKYCMFNSNLCNLWTFLCH